MKYKKYIKNFTNAVINIFLIYLLIAPIVYYKDKIADLLFLFNKNPVIGSIVGSVVGGISIGNPVNSYIIASELLKVKVPISLISSFIVAWVTVGIAQIPLEAKYFGKKFAIIRNIIGLLFAIAIGILAWFLI